MTMMTKVTKASVLNKNGDGEADDAFWAHAAAERAGNSCEHGVDSHDGTFWHPLYQGYRRLSATSQRTLLHLRHNSSEMTTPLWI